MFAFQKLVGSDPFESGNKKKIVTRRKHADFFPAPKIPDTGCILIPVAVRIIAFAMLQMDVTFSQKLYLPIQYIFKHEIIILSNDFSVFSFKCQGLSASLISGFRVPAFGC